MNKVTQKWFNEWADEYDLVLGNQRRHHQMLDLAIQMSKVKDGELVLEIGCGTGLLSMKFLQAANCTMHGIDLAEDMLKLCKKRMEDLNLASRISIKQGDITDLEFEDSTFDIVASTVTLHHLKDKQPTINKIYRILKPRGRFVLGDLDVDTSGDLNNVERLRHILDFLKDEVSAALEEGGVDAFSRMYDNGKKHILNDGEYCISFEMWSQLCKNAGFEHLNTAPVDSSGWRKVLCAYK